MRVLFAAVLLAAFAALSAPASADPKSDMASIWIGWAGVSSYHAVATTSEGTTVSYDYINPNKWHFVMPQAEMIRIAGDTWVNHDGKWMQLPSMMSGRMTSMTDRMVMRRPSGEDDYTYTFVGAEKLNNVSTRHYRMTRKNGDTVDVWAGPSNLPLQIQTHEQKSSTTVVFSNYNHVADITPPSM